MNPFWSMFVGIHLQNWICSCKSIMFLRNVTDINIYIFFEVVHIMS